jgi:hypothetical protein
MATTTKAKKAAPKKAAATESKSGAGAAMAERSKDAKASFGKAAPKTVKSPAAAKSPAAKSTAKPAKAAAPAKTAKASPSLATRVMRKVKDTAEGAVTMAASVIGKGGPKEGAKGK